MLVLVSSENKASQPDSTKSKAGIMKDSLEFRSGYADVNGLKMYYEIYGEGNPLVLIHGGGSTIQTSFGNIIPYLAKHRRIIAMELQAHGRTGDRPAELSFKQDADDVAMLLSKLEIPEADFLGYSNGGHTLIEIALRHPEVVDKMILASTFYKRSAVAPQFWEGFDQVTIDAMPDILREGFLEVNNDNDALLNMFNKDVQRMKDFQGWSDDQMRSINVPALIISSSEDVGSPEHAVEIYRIIPHCELAIIPGKHGAYLGARDYLGTSQWEQTYTVDIIESFLDATVYSEPGKTTDLRVTHLFNAPIEQVWLAMTNDRSVRRWWYVDGFSNILAKMDVREGGVSQVGMRASKEYGGNDYYNVWKYTKVVPRKFLQYISNFADNEGNVITPEAAGLPAETPMGIKQQIEFEESEGNKTKVTVTEFGWLAEGVMLERSRNGLEQTLNNIDKVLSEPDQ